MIIKAYYTQSKHILLNSVGCFMFVFLSNLQVRALQDFFNMLTNVSVFKWNWFSNSAFLRLQFWCHRLEFALHIYSLVPHFQRGLNNSLICLWIIAANEFNWSIYVFWLTAGFSSCLLWTKACWDCTRPSCNSDSFNNWYFISVSCVHQNWR